MVSTTLLIRVVILEGFMCVGALLLLFGHRAWLCWHSSQDQARLARARALGVAYLAGTALTPHVRDWLRTLPRRLQRQLFVDLATSLSGAQRQQLAILADEMGVMAHAIRRCTSRLWWRRLHSMRWLTLLGSGGDVVLPLLGDQHPVVRAQAAAWAVDHPSPRVLDALLSLLGDANGLCRFTAQDTLLRLGGVAIEPLAHMLSSLSGRQLEVALAVAIGLAEPRFLAPALHLCHDVSPQVRTLTASLLGALGGQEGTAALVTLLGDTAPEVRAAAARALGKLGHWPAASHLAPLLRDPAWAVRRSAGLALRALGAPGLLFLRRCLTEQDPFAADMARQVLDLPDTAGLAAALG